jgi:hypothetical protein
MVARMVLGAQVPAADRPLGAAASDAIQNWSR